MSRFLTIVALALVATNVAATESATAADTYAINTFSRPLSHDTFAEAQSKNNLLVLYHGSGCALTEKFLPKFEELAAAFADNTNIVFATINCEAEATVCAEQKGQAYQLRLFIHDNADSQSVRFNGVRDVDGLARFFIKHLGDDVLDGTVHDVPRSLGAINELTAENFADHVAVGEHFVKFYAPWCGHCQRLAPTWDELAVALEYDDSVSISKVDCTQHRPVCADFEVKGYPSLLWIVDGKRVDKYTGARSLDDLKAYVEKTAVARPKTVIYEATAAAGGVAEDAGVLLITGDNFDHAIEKGVTFVKFYAPWCGHCKRLAPRWEELAAKFVGEASVKIAKVDCTLSDNKGLCSEQDVNGFPTIFIYRDGAKLGEYTGTRTLEDLVQFVQGYSQRDEL